MKLDDLMFYDKIVIWGLGQDFKSLYKRQFRVDYFVDKTINNIEDNIDSMNVISVEQLKGICDISKVLIVVSSRKYYEEIVNEIQNNKIIGDVISLTELVEIYGTHNKSFCLWGIDVLVKDILKRSSFNIKDTSYIEVGANHPFIGSATASLYLEGARGILIEPNPDLESIITKCRPDDIYVNCGIGKENGELIFYRFEENSYRNSFDIVEVNKNVARGYKLKDEIPVSVETLENIIERYNIDTSKTYLSIQVMGLEEEVLGSFDYRKYDFPIISIAYYEEKVLENDIFKEYIEIARVPRHVILVKSELYHKIFN